MDLTFLPAILNDEPTEQMLLEITTSKIRMMKVALRVAGNIHIRCRLAEAQNWKCCWCGIECVPESNHKHSATIEHVLPRSAGGLDEWDNYAMACGGCNHSRGNISDGGYANAVALVNAHNLGLGGIDLSYVDQFKQFVCAFEEQKDPEYDEYLRLAEKFNK